MSETGPKAEPTVNGIDAQLALLESLAADCRMKAERIRAARLPQHVGMAAAARALAADVPRALLAQVQDELGSGALGRQWEAALERLSGGDRQGRPEVILAAVATLLVEQAQRAGRLVAARADEWTQDACRLEGYAGALEEQVAHLARTGQGIATSRVEDVLGQHETKEP